MNYWILPCDPTYFRIHDFIRDHQFVEWKQRHYKYEAGDIIFIYDCAPESKLAYIMEVVGIDISLDRAFDDSGYLLSGEEDYYNGFVTRLNLVKEITTDKLSLHDLLEHGLKLAPKGPMHAKGDLLSYILDNIIGNR